jgi:alkaline phosphatase
MKRVKLIKTSILVLLTVFISVGCDSKQESTPKAKYVFYFIGDGMGYQHDNCNYPSLFGSS